MHFTKLSQRTQTSLGCLQDIWKKSWRLTTKPDVFPTSGRKCWIYDIFKRLYLRCLEDVRIISSKRRLIYDVLKTSDLWRLGDVGLRLLDDLCKTTSLEEATCAQRQKILFFLILYCLKYCYILCSTQVSIKVWNFVNY